MLKHLKIYLPKKDYNSRSGQMSLVLNTPEVFGYYNQYQKDADMSYDQFLDLSIKTLITKIEHLVSLPIVKEIENMSVNIDYAVYISTKLPKEEALIRINSDCNNLIMLIDNLLRVSSPKPIFITNETVGI